MARPSTSDRQVHLANHTQNPLNLKSVRPMPNDGFALSKAFFLHADYNRRMRMSMLLNVNREFIKADGTEIVNHGELIGSQG